MPFSVDQIVARLDDPGTPVIWLDPALPESLWEALPLRARQAGYRVIHLDHPGPHSSLHSLLDAFSRVLPAPLAASSLQALRDALLALPADTGPGWVVLFHFPESLRQNDEVAFEDLIETLESVHESRYSDYNQVFKLVVRD